VKQAIFDQTGILPERQCLAGAGAQMEDHRKLTDYMVMQGESTIHAVVREMLHVESSQPPAQSDGVPLMTSVSVTIGG
jgi:hypothetical protein